MYLLGLGAAPFLDPPEGFHVAVAESLRASGDWITLRVDGVRYFDKPPLPYWLMALSFAAAGPSEAAARIWPALSAIGVAAVTGRIGVMLGGPRVGLLAALFVASNLGVFLFGRQVKPDLALHPLDRAGLRRLRRGLPRRRTLGPGASSTARSAWPR